MLGRVRPSSIGSLGLLELERPNSKLIKDDSLSIYETTLLKLKRGSLRNPSLAPENSTGTDENCTMASDLTEPLIRSSTDSLPISSSCESTGTDQGTKSLSILYLFSRYKNSQQHSISSPDGMDMLAGSAFSSIRVSPSPSNDQLLSSSKQY
ncbi:hypothetical protein Adt_00585 [Abeliophyllum distichum]|uniref:Uncharacterized protein n=1 Tax=Abeliophyllum distichum TaxID=126358 RepID=A0ABD1VQH2_9LAMI